MDAFTQSRGKDSLPGQKEERDVSGVMGVCVCRMLSNAHLNNEYESECAGGVSGHVVPM